jgi:dTDP-4-dehydrorhamnose 3,5-epimerase
LHYQVKKPQGKLVRVTRGEVFDVAVDINPDSPTYTEWVGVNLSEENYLQFWVPPGYAHGFIVLSGTADFLYKCTDFYDPTDERGINWKDPTLDINWPIPEALVSKKDSELPYLQI